MPLIYNLLSLIALTIYSPLLIFKKGPENKPVYLKERLGISKYANTDIWIHAVSVGEVMAALPFLISLKKELPNSKILLSTTTYTGQKIAREKFPDADKIMYMPWDTWLSVNRAVKMLKPKIFITIETELWPALFKALKKNGSYILILNGRLSHESFKGYKRVKFFMKGVLSDVDFMYMQGRLDAERIISIGADEKKVGIMGNFKFDIELDKKNEPHWMDNIKGQIILAGSTHKGEEVIILDAFETIKKNIPDLKLILTPRHPERFNEVEEILKRRNLNFIRRTKLRVKSSELRVQKKENEPDKHETSSSRFADLILLDTIGELPQIYALATIAFIGGSLLPYGGHNILEPAFWGKPIVFGPYMDNFPIAEEFLKQGAAVMAKDAKDTALILNNLLNDTEKATQMGHKAKAIVNNHAGAVKKAIELVRSLIGNSQHNL